MTTRKLFFCCRCAKSAKLNPEQILTTKDSSILDLCELILTTNGFNVSTISDCGDLYIKIHSFKPDVILMDLWITKFGGEEAINIIKQNGDTKDIAILIFSALSGLDKICQKLGADGFIEKTFDVEDFIKKINKTLVLKEEKARKKIDSI